MESTSLLSMSSHEYVPQSTRIRSIKSFLLYIAYYVSVSNTPMGSVKKILIQIISAITFLWLMQSSLCAQDLVAFDSDKDYEISYYYDKLEVYDFKETSSIPYTKLEEEVNEGFDNGVYWFRITPTEKVKSDAYVLSFRYVHTTDVHVFYENRVIQPMSNTRFKSFKVELNDKSEPIIVKVNCFKEAYIPIKLLPLEDYFRAENANRAQIGLYYGIVFSVLLLHLFYFINLKKSTYLFYMFLLVSLGLTIAYRDGFVYYFFGDGWLNKNIEPLFNIMVATSALVFASAYLDLKKLLPKFKWIGVTAIIVCALSYMVYLLTENYTLFVITEDLIIGALLLIYTTSVLLYKKNIYAKIFAWAYGGMTIACVEFYNSTFFGFKLTGMQIEQFRIGGVIEMVIFTFAITYQSRMMARNNRNLQLDIAIKNRELVTYTLQLAEKNAFLKSIKDFLTEIKKAGDSEVRKITHRTDRFISNAMKENSWDEFKIQFEKVNPDFYQNLNNDFPDLSKSEIRLATFLKLKMSSKETAAMLNLGERSVISARSKLRKKFNLSREANLYDFIDSY